VKAATKRAEDINARVCLRADCLEERVKISKETTRRRVHGAPYGPVRSRRRDLQATWEFFSRPTEFLATFPRRSLARVCPYSPCRRRDEETGRLRLIPGANTPTGIILGLFCRST